MRSSSRTSVAVRPSLQWLWMMLITCAPPAQAHALRKRGTCGAGLWDARNAAARRGRRCREGRRKAQRFLPRRASGPACLTAQSCMLAAGRWPAAWKKGKASRNKRSLLCFFTLRNIWAGTTCTSSMSSRPHSRDRIVSITCGRTACRAGVRRRPQHIQSKPPRPHGGTTAPPLFRRAVNDDCSLKLERTQGLRRV